MPVWYVFLPYIDDILYKILYTLQYYFCINTKGRYAYSHLENILRRKTVVLQLNQSFWLAGPSFSSFMQVCMQNASNTKFLGTFQVTLSTFTC